MELGNMVVPFPGKGLSLQAADNFGRSGTSASCQPPQKPLMPNIDVKAASLTQQMSTESACRLLASCLSLAADLPSIELAQI
jgi:hypothetical protein